jgi:hypothetical protein
VTPKVRKLGVLALGAAFVAAAFVVIEGAASSASDAPLWRWQGAIASGSETELASTISSGDRIALFAVRDASNQPALIVRANGQDVQRAPASAIASGSPLAAFVVGDSAGTQAILGLAREDAAHVFLVTSGATAQELPVNGSGAFAAPGVPPGARAELEAIGSDGATLARLVLPSTGGFCGGALGVCNGQQRAGPNAQALPRAFSRARRATDALPKDAPFSGRLTVGSLNGARSEKIVDSRRIAAYTDGRGRRALLYLIRSKSEICAFTFWGSGAGGGCSPSANFFGGGHVAVGSGHLLSGVADDSVASIVIVGTRGVRHRAALTADGGFIYDCKAYNGCTCVVDHVEAFNSAGQKIESDHVGGRCARTTQSGRQTQATSAAPSRAHGTIGWLFRHEPRGQSLAQAAIRITRTVGSHWQPVRFARVLTPDSHSRARIVLSLIGKRGRNVCMTLFPSGANATNDAGGGGCAVGLTLTPLSTMIAYGLGGGYIAGAAEDQVVRITLQLGDGSAMSVSLRDNVFFIHIPPGVTPRTLVSFDRNGHAIGRDSVPPAALPLVHGARVGASRLQATQTVRRYTISNRGRLVPGRGNKIFDGHPYQLFLLGTIKGKAFYRIQLTPHYTCWGSGPADKVGTLRTSGCPGVVGAYPLQLDDNVVELKQGAQTPRSLQVAGIVADQAASVALRDDHGKTLATVPVANNLFAFTPPFPRAFLRPVPLDANGKALPPHPEWGQHQTPPPNLWGPRAQTVRPSQLGAVVQRGEGRGVKVSVGENGVVVFDTRGIDAAAKRALGEKNASFACFQLSGQNVRHNRSAGISTAVAPEVAVRLVGVKPHYDGCEAGGSYGHRWRDQHGSHSAIEVAFTPQGRRYFEDRATARDLAAFVRSAKTQSIRRKTGAALVAAIRNAYGTEVQILASATARAAAGQVGVWNRDTRTIFSEVSRLGDRLYVEFDNGKIVKQNVRGLALVF